MLLNENRVSFAKRCLYSPEDDISLPGVVLLAHAATYAYPLWQMLVVLNLLAYTTDFLCGFNLDNTHGI